MTDCIPAVCYNCLAEEKRAKEKVKADKSTIVKEISFHEIIGKTVKTIANSWNESLAIVFTDGTFVCLTAKAYYNLKPCIIEGFDINNFDLEKAVKTGIMTEEDRNKILET